MPRNVGGRKVCNWSLPYEKFFGPGAMCNENVLNDTLENFLRNTRCKAFANVYPLRIIDRTVTKFIESLRSVTNFG